jgi:hypothetical protein
MINSIQEMMDSFLVKQTIKKLFGSNSIEIISRPASYVIKLQKESDNLVKRIILLPPKGFTSNKVDETSPHPEVRKAKITIKGGVRSGKQGFDLLKYALKFAYYTSRDIKVEDNYPYAKIDIKNPLFKEELKSSRDKLFVVKENGEGFYHNLINNSSSWILIVLEKELRLQKNPNIYAKIENLAKKKQNIILESIADIKKDGDEIFSKKHDLIKSLTDLPTEETLPALIEALNIQETGKHEQCTVYALILKFARKNPKFVLNCLNMALEKKEAQSYYLEELIKKTKAVSK